MQAFGVEKNMLHFVYHSPKTTEIVTICFNYFRFIRTTPFALAPPLVPPPGESQIWSG